MNVRALLDKYRPKNASRNVRGVDRGDFGSAPLVGEDGKFERYPRRGVYDVLTSTLERSSIHPTCQVDFDATNATYAEIAADDVRLSQFMEQHQIPAGQACLASVALFAEQALRKGKEVDRRTIRLDTPEFDALTLPGKAMVCINKARQLKSVALSKIKPEVADVRQRHQGSRMLAPAAFNQVATQGVVPDTRHRINARRKYTGCELLLRAYQYIREYEMNPPPPLTVHESGVAIPNFDRVLSDRDYFMLMGTGRLEPNRLGIGRRARSVWAAFRIFDVHYYGPNYASIVQGEFIENVDEMELQDIVRLIPPDNMGEVSELTLQEDGDFAPLYGNITPTHAQYAMGFMVYLQKHLNGFGEEDEIPHRVADPTQLSIQLHRVVPDRIDEWDWPPLVLPMDARPDAARALRDVHYNFPPPPVDWEANATNRAEPNPRLPLEFHLTNRSDMNDIALWQGSNPQIDNAPFLLSPLPGIVPPACRVDTLPPPRMRHKPYASPGIRNVPGGPFSIYFPSGCSHLQGPQPPYQQLPVGEISEMPIPLQQVVDRNRCWDCRNSLLMLHSEMSRLRKVVALQLGVHATQLWEGGQDVSESDAW